MTSRVLLTLPVCVNVGWSKSEKKRHQFETLQFSYHQIRLHVYGRSPSYQQAVPTSKYNADSSPFVVTLANRFRQY